MRTLSLAHLSFLDLPPPALIHLAADAGFNAVGLRLIAVTNTTPGYPLMTDPKMMRETRAAMRDTGVKVNDIEFIRLTPEFSAQAFDPFLDAGAELGAKYIVTAPYDPDLNRLTQNLAAFADRAAGFNLSPVLEFFPWTNVPDLKSAMEIVKRTGNEAVGVLLDTLHFDRSESGLSDVTKTDPKRLPFVHLCDALVQPTYTEAELLATARSARLIPGDGQIPLIPILNTLSPAIPISLEVPLMGTADSIPRLTLASRMFASTLALLDT